ncbi:Rid family detoxifying hydrolase [Taibaiella helva]|uniref:Rid family detoxifying hydrolase n=1 Tax=Taibaiella helva TaxID=2301235 RepID=UPI000E58550A|nr:Rid family detoxifying hydrolase [Taibaiella helva]
MNVLNTANAPAAVGPYCQGIVPTAPGVPVFLSGQVGIDPATGALVEGLEAQTRQVFKNIEAVLAETGLTLKDITYANVLLTDIGDFKEVNGYYAEIFGEHRPTRAAYAVSALPLGALIEVVVIAWKSL